MDDKEMIRNFGDMVNAADKLSNPWKKFALASLAVTVITNLFWCFIVGMLVYFAYMTPAEMTQEQEFSEQRQSQSCIQGATNGD